MAGRTEAERAAAIDALLDKAELHDLAMRYARAVDRGDAGLLLSVYHPDAVDHHGTDFKGSPAAFVDYLKETTARFEVTAHYIVNSHYRIDGDRAEGELYFIAYHRAHPPEANEITIAGRYLDRYERRDGGWRIAHRSLVWDWVTLGAMPPHALQLLRERGDGGCGAGDPSYAALPLLARSG